ncbi:high nitrogen upregulated cytochrome P450 monooxygenase 1, variant 1 [Blastomyces gilchristii SLH14081]|uniref:High nitrogen upregulated cytochrome P450 monooxygenase 1 n=1 Tax=Blastomyces gilchristii (strain SLH14081) TaxID=559298 RepID=A0A179V105_BLAGS|nr:high nitrogen upregulated cytochrome P450 monooxygenase 1 [Blastomyces gilchristii SLH14081]XP_031581217.1 high nitrogen upregulated cytochrome P450 monooxygenase 1, variant 1 [Blastomyces gilchristii SLH14081]OAT13985.1 high nitrogen upregulated cytochrome P450 monooxygenase 1 [Blastomyces gilchristii SLH14081]OAT13986.1 high nitrogen upregulated cytochrome P450 monooxygenase 1, variant 1 [Blastomyces gilchristii SLH14081]
MLQLACTAGIALGILSHLLLFKHGEWDRYAPTLVLFYAFAMSVLSPVVVFILMELSMLSTLLLVSTFWISYMTGLFGSIGLYRGWLHRLTQFPGPVAWKLSSFGSIKASVGEFKFPVKVQQLHETYGDFVRIRPREISINHVDAVRDIHGPGTTCVKGPFYDITYPFRSLQMLRDKGAHSRRRRIWDRGLGIKALTTYEPKILGHCADLISQLSAKSKGGKPIHIGPWMNYFGFDVIGDVAFSKPFNMVKDGKAAEILEDFLTSKPALGTLICAPWTFNLVQNLPGLRRLWEARTKNHARKIAERMKLGTTCKDLFSYLLEDGPASPAASAPLVFSEFSVPGDLACDSELAITAGSDTVAATLTSLIYILATHPDKQTLLQQELDTLLTGIADISYQKLSVPNNAPMLEGVILETLRLYPGTPGGMQRMTPPEGARIAGRWIPGNTLVSTPTYTLHRGKLLDSPPHTLLNNPHHHFATHVLSRTHTHTHTHTHSHPRPAQLRSTNHLHPRALVLDTKPNKTQRSLQPLPHRHQLLRRQGHCAHGTTLRDRADLSQVHSTLAHG